ncbi:MAG: hypothetical protein EBU82_07025 [Flavobacteriia bacterium]|nr:hypothetical protein [Flavobacteriia bacterium]
MATLGFLYSFLYCQRNAEPFYIHDTLGYFQPLLKTSPILHYLKTVPSTVPNLNSDPQRFAPVLNAMSLPSLKRTIDSIFQYNGETLYKIDTFLSNFNLLKPSFDVGIVLDVSGCVPIVITGLKQIQRRTNKKTLKVFVMTENMELLREFATTGDPSWTYTSLMRIGAPKDKEYQLTKVLAELKIMKQIEFLAFRFASPLGKLLYLNSEKVNTESQVISVDGQGWKAI